MTKWSTPPVLGRKRVELRYCIDYPALNAKTYKDNYSLPLIEDCQNTLYNKHVFCVFDLCSGYFQIPLKLLSVLGLVVTKGPVYRWACVPLQQLFSRAMQLVLRGLTWEEVIVYMDDVIVLWTDFANARLALRKAFTSFREHGWKLKPRKCNFFKEEVDFLVTLVSRSGVSISADKLEAVKQWCVPH